MQRFIRILLATILVSTSTAHSQSLDLDMPMAQRSQVRSQIRECQAALVTADQTDDSVGIPFTARSPEEFHSQVKSAIEKYGMERLKGGTFYVMGVKMQDESRVQNAYDSAARSLGLDQIDVKVVVLSVPSEIIQRDSVDLATDILQRVKYFLPSLKRDYQAPLLREIRAGILSTALVEAPTIYFLHQTMPKLEATLTIGAHVTTLLTLIVFTKTLVNWILRSSYKNEVLAYAERLILKQGLVSTLFVANFNVFGHFTEISNFYQSHGSLETLGAAVPEAVPLLLTVAIQNWFYEAVITRGFGGWVNEQVGTENSSDARELRPWLQLPVLIGDALLLAMASSKWGGSLLSFGPMDFNWGHAGILAMTISGILFFKKYPSGLNVTFKPFRRLREWFNRRSSGDSSLSSE